MISRDTQRLVARQEPALSWRTTAVLTGTLALLALVALPVREDLYLAVARGAHASPAASLVGFIADKGLLVLVAVAGVLAVRSWLSDRRAFWSLAAAGVGVVAAYLSSEALKILVTEERPCRVLTLTTVGACPSPGDWSWPSNHSVIAAAFATACLLVVPRIGWFVVPVAVTIGLSRVATGVHYVHDVLSGFALGFLVVALVAALLAPLVTRLAPDRRPDLADR